MEKIVNRELLFSSESRVLMRGQVYNVPRGLVWNYVLDIAEREKERRNRAEEGERELRAVQRSFAVDCGLRKLREFDFQKCFLSS